MVRVDRPLADAERAQHHGRAAGDPVDVGPTPEGADGGEPQLGAPLEVPLAGGVGGHARDLDEVLQQLLELTARVRGVLLERGPSERHGMPRMTPT